MSSMPILPPPGLGGPGAGPAGPPGGGGGLPGRPDSPKVTDLIQQAADLLQQAIGLEKDPEDKAMLADLFAKAHKFAGSQQKLVDSAVGAGPGVKLVRKAAPGGPSGGPGY
jgi:hypothetical protein